MNESRKPVVNQETAGFAGSPAPSPAADGAHQGGAADPDHTDSGDFHCDEPLLSGKAPGDFSPRKHRFMTALLDKLKVHAAVDSPDDGSLAETRASDVPTSRIMTFTYPPGSTPLPRYTIRRGIGMGGFGEVYFAVSEAGKEVALKRIQRNLDVELRGVSHCLNLKHPNLVSLYDVCRDPQGQSWVVMEYVAGMNLRQVLDESPDGLPDSEVRRWFGAIAAGISHLHSAGLVHRDVKPGNVFDDLGTVKVGDYGLSKFISASHRDGHTESVGTFHYMAPEIGRGQYGREIDIYALGILLYELLTGRVPFDGESCHEIIVKHLTATPDLTGISEPYLSTIARCLEKDPAKRFSTVSGMMLSLGIDEHGAPLPAVLVAERVDDAVAAEAFAVAVAADRSDGDATPRRPVGGGHAETDEGAVKGAGAIAGGAAVVPSRSASIQDEPFARAIRHSLADLGRWWESLDRSPGAKAFMMIVGAFVLVVNTHWLLPLLSIVGVFYVPYYIVRQMVLHVRQQPSYAQAQRIASAAGVRRRPITKSQWRTCMRTDLRAKRSIHRVAELNTSWVAASITAMAMALGAGVIGLRSGPVDAVAIAPYGWMAIVVLIASLGLLGMGKLWEREEGEGLPRRLVLAGVGAGVGMAAFGMSEFLMLPLDASAMREMDATDLPQAMYNADGTPLASAMMAHFALLFAALRWWKPVDPLRRTRLSLWAVTVAVVVEWAVHQVLPIPQPAGMLIAGGIAIAVQMAAPWINPHAVPPPWEPSDRAPVDGRPAGTRSVA